MFKPETPAVTSEATAELLPGYARYRALAANVPEKFRKELKVGYHHHATSAGIAPSLRTVGDHLFSVELDRTFIYRDSDEIGLSVAVSHVEAASGDKLAFLLGEGTTPEEVKARDAEAAELVQQITRGRMTLVHTSRSSAAGPGIHTTTYTLQGEPLLLARCDDEGEPAVEEDCEENPNGGLEEA